MINHIGRITPVRRAAPFAAGLLLFAFQCPGAPAASPPQAPSVLSAYAKPKTLVTLTSGRKLNVRCEGTGSPTIVLTAGAGDQSLAWHSLQPVLSRLSRVCAWDRAGFGFSDASPAPQDADHTTADLEALLAGGAIAPPYLLVGHSLGSYETLMFAFRHLGQVAGIVLIDPAAPYQDERLKHAAPATYAVIDKFQREQIAAVKGCIRWLRRATGSVSGSTIDPRCISDPVDGYPADLKQALLWADGSIANQQNRLSLLVNAFDRADSRELMRLWRPLGNLPLVVLTAGALPPLGLSGSPKEQIPDLLAEWFRLHDEIARLSTRGINRQVPGATHYIYLQRPHLVTEAIESEMLVIRQGKTPHASASGSLQH